MKAIGILIVLCTMRLNEIVRSVYIEKSKDPTTEYWGHSKKGEEVKSSKVTEENWCPGR